jgi:hypothetical protein
MNFKDTRRRMPKRMMLVVVGALIALSTTAGIALATSGDVWQAHITMTPGYAQLPAQHLDGGTANGGEDLYVNGQVWNGSLTNQATGATYQWTGKVDQMFAANPNFSSELLDSGSFTLTGQKGQTVCTGTLALNRDHHSLGTQGYYQGVFRFAAAPKGCPFAGTLQLVYGTDVAVPGSPIDLAFVQR